MSVETMNKKDFGTVEDGFGSCWVRCKEDCSLCVVRPGKAQCGECDSKCNNCGGEFKHYTPENSPYDRISGYMCLACMDGRGFKRKEDSI